MPSSPLAGIGDELDRLRAFVALLQREQECLARADVDALLPLIDAKSTFSAELAEFSRVRESALSSLQLPAGGSGIKAWLEKSKNPAERKAWADLVALAAKVRNLNETNGKLIGLHLKHNQHAFNALMAAANRAMTYGPDGHQQTGLGGRILGKA